MDRLNSKNYDLLWKWGVPCLFISIYLESGYKKIDTISYNEGETNYFFISKEARKKFSKKGYKLYTSEFDAFCKKARKSMVELESYLKEEKLVDLHALNQKSFIKGFKRMAQCLRKSWTDYLPTEVHHTDLVAKIVESGGCGIKRRLIAKNLKRMGILRQNQRGIINRIMYAPGPFYSYVKEASRRLDKDISCFNYREVIQMLQERGVSRRLKFQHIIIGKFNNWQPITGKKAVTIFKKLLPFSNYQKEFKGIIANKGLYKGRVRKIEFDLKTDFEMEMKRMKKGEILVSGSTGPEMILACKKAGAIITEEGGILSHAAIVSREFSIPCIVGTKIATRILKTGDLIEVDANKGVVKILKRAKK